MPRRRLMKLGGMGLAAATALRAGVAQADQVPDPRPPRLTGSVYVARAGHHLSGAFLAWWVQQGGERTLGLPVTETQRIDGTDTQFFERGALARVAPGGDAFAVAPLDLGRTWAARIDVGALRPDVGDASSEYRFWRSGRGVHPAFWRTFVDNGGAYAFGYPISNAVVRDGRLTQWFARARLSEDEGGVGVDDLGFWEALRLRAPTARVTPGARVTPYRPSLLDIDTGPPEARWVEVDLPQQVVTFFAGDAPLRRALVSTGREPGWTPDGTWRVFLRKRDERMRGPDPDAADYYDLSNVYFTQYFTRAWDALHYAWWHDEFGTVKSRGCVNMRYDDAAWAWSFCQDGTPIVIHTRPGVRPPPPV